MMCDLGSYYYDLCPIHEKVFKDFLVGKWKWIIYVVKGRLFHDIYFVYTCLCMYMNHIKMEKYKNINTWVHFLIYY